jgi:SagB-type dehydrogenase family enzyme
VITATEQKEPATNQLSASAMSFAVAADPQFRMPDRPRLVPGLIVVPMIDGLLIEGTAERQVLRGGAARTLLPHLMSVLDGTRDLAELAAQLPDVPPADVRAAISLLYVCGLLEDAAVPGADPDGSPVGAYLGRHLDTTRVNRSAAEAVQRLATARIAIPGGGAISKAVGDLLRDAGAEVVDIEDERVRPDLVVAVGEPDGIDPADVAAACERRGLRWLCSAGVDGEIEIGPLFDPVNSACFDCFRAGRPAPTGPAIGPARAAVWAGLLATEVIHVLTRTGLLQSASGCTVTDVETWGQRILGVYRRPGCPRCCPAPDVAVPLAAYHYEQAVAFPPREQLNPKDHQHHYRPANLALQRDAKSYSGALRIAFVGADPSEPTSARLSTPCIAAILERIAGLRVENAAPGRVQRWSPTGGNLGSVQAYLLAVDIDGLPPGWYFYEPRDPALTRVRALEPGEATLSVTRIVPGAPAGVPALLVLTGALVRVATKYHNFAYRILYLDSGVALAQLAAVADERGVTAQAAPRWDDVAVGAALGINLDQEPVTAVATLVPHGGPDV